MENFLGHESLFSVVHYNRTSNNGHLPTTATFLQRGHFSTTATSLQRSLLYNGYLSQTTATSLKWPPLDNNHLSTTITSPKQPLFYNGHLSTIGTVTIEIVQEYTYLGTRLTPTGNFTLAQEHLKEKALHVFSSIRKYTLLHRLNPNTAAQIFDSMIFLILSYNREVWGIYTKQDFNQRLPEQLMDE